MIDSIHHERNDDMSDSSFTAHTWCLNFYSNQIAASSFIIVINLVNSIYMHIYRLICHHQQTVPIKIFVIQFNWFALLLAVAHLSYHTKKMTATTNWRKKNKWFVLPVGQTPFFQGYLLQRCLIFFRLFRRFRKRISSLNCFLLAGRGHACALHLYAEIDDNYSLNIDRKM